ncbi:MAG: hypothetical protein ACFB4J_06740 [Elainellaceae cyanobacterium]
MHKRFRHGALGTIVAALVIGLLLRGVNLSENLYWVDEVYTALRLAGHTQETVLPLLSQPIQVADLAPFQGTAGAFAQTLWALAQHPEHPPLYYLTAWGALALGPPGPAFVGLLRWVSVLFGLLALPAVYWLCWELWRPLKAALPGVGHQVGPQVSVIALALVTLSPLHVLYAQEAREYGLWTSLILIAGAALLRAIAVGGRWWWVYGVSVALGLYSHLLFGLVVLVHGAYVLLTGHRSLRAYGIATAAAIAAFLPWVWVGLQRLGQLGAVAEGVQRETSLNYLINVWARNLNRVFFNGDWGSANLLILGLALYSVYHLWRTQREFQQGQQQVHRPALFIALLIALPALALLIPDVVLGGIRSARIRYLIPAYLGGQLAIAHLFASQLTQRRGWGRRGWSAGLALVLVASGGASAISTQISTSWAKSDKSVYYPAMAEAINASDRPWVLNDSSVGYFLALAHRLKPETVLQMVDPQRVEPHPGHTVFLFAPSPKLRRIAQRRYGPLQLRVEQNPQFQLWQMDSGAQAGIPAKGSL